MTKKTKSIILVALLLVVGITSGYVASTYAKYSTSSSGNGTIPVAKWAFATDNASSGTYTTTITTTTGATADATTLVAGKIAPGTKGSFSITLVNTNTEVGVDFTVALGTIANTPTNLKFYKDAALTTELTSDSTITGQLKANDATGVVVKIYWAWVYETGTVTNGVATGDAADTTDGTAAASVTIPITVKGVQVVPGATAITSHID